MGVYRLNDQVHKGVRDNGENNSWADLQGSARSDSVIGILDDRVDSQRKSVGYDQQSERANDPSISLWAGLTCEFFLSQWISALTRSNHLAAGI